ncbi:MAG: hypothetical protein J3Q66DRAFT_407496 [Benniella sp.]|nr:MAG: hypothetical protein J3Q66DRAFT_407496 [Benniella sp.]
MPGSVFGLHSTPASGDHPQRPSMPLLRPGVQPQDLLALQGNPAEPQLHYALICRDAGIQLAGRVSLSPNVEQKNISVRSPITSSRTVQDLKVQQRSSSGDPERSGGNSHHTISTDDQYGKIAAAREGYTSRQRLVVEPTFLLVVLGSGEIQVKQQASDKLSIPETRRYHERHGDIMKLKRDKSAGNPAATEAPYQMDTP